MQRKRIGGKYIKIKSCQSQNFFPFLDKNEKLLTREKLLATSKPLTDTAPAFPEVWKEIFLPGGAWKVR